MLARKLGGPSGYRKNERQASRGWYGLLYLSFGIYVMLMGQVILFKTLPLDSLFHERLNTIRSVNMIPFRTIGQSLVQGAMDSGQLMENIGGNILIFIPLGLFVAFIARRWSFWGQIAVVLGISLLFEISQYVFALGSSDIDDVLLNITGGVLGIGLYLWLENRTRTPRKLVVMLTGIYLLVGAGGIASITAYDTSLIPFVDAKVVYADENKEVMAGWEEASRDLFGDLEGVGKDAITVRTNPAYMVMTRKSTEGSDRETATTLETEPKEVTFAVDAKTKIFIRYIHDEGKQVISRYEAVSWSWSEAAHWLEREGADQGAGSAQPPTVSVWYSEERPGVAGALLISMME
ncbi:VanZ family protein [Paenibacillus sanguinis]|uniref:VanZ family protein n=1 Tax=Paenibacillus sanguinis TaxID=225906 RepID=UPI000371BA23|nr:VanZ family protein [Paenibacillus sanguinis]